jgi:hypothetical protein
MKKKKKKKGNWQGIFLENANLEDQEEDDES